MEKRELIYEGKAKRIYTTDTCRFWDATTRTKLDKDRFRQDLGGVEEAYHEIDRRVCAGA